MQDVEKCRRMIRIFAVSIACLAGFVIVAWQVATGGPLTELDRSLSLRFYDFARADSDRFDWTIWATDLNLGRPRMILMVAVTVVLLLDRKFGLALAWLGSQYYVHELIGDLKMQFERPRPDFPDSLYIVGGYSFPSGHAGGAFAFYAMLAYVVWRQQFPRWVKSLSFVLLAGMTILIGVTRMLLGVHWFSDVLGGFLIAGAYVGLWVFLCEFVSGLKHCPKSKPELHSVGSGPVTNKVESPHGQ